MSFLVADRFTEKAWHQGKSAGILFTTPEILFGREVASAISELIDVLSHAAKTAKERPDSVSDLFNKLGKIEGAAGNLRGPLFELIVAHIISVRMGGNLEVGKLIRASGSEEAEIDVLAYNQACLRACECKGHLASRIVSKDEIESWLSIQIPRWRSWALEQAHLRDASHCFEYWTTGKIAPDALELLRERAESCKKYRISWKDSEGVLAEADDVHASHLRRTIREHYLEHPLA